MAVLSRLSPNRRRNHVHDHGCQRTANAPEPTETTTNTPHPAADRSADARFPLCPHCVMDIQDEDLERCVPPQFTLVFSLISLKGTHSQFGGHFCRRSISDRSPASTPRVSIAIAIHPATRHTPGRGRKYSLQTEQFPVRTCPAREGAVGTPKAPSRKY